MVLYGNIWENHGNIWGYPLIIWYIAIENGLFEIVDLAVKHGGSFHSCLYVYQRVSMIMYLVAHSTARKWLIALVTTGISSLNSQKQTGVTTHLLSRMNHQVDRYHLIVPFFADWIHYGFDHCNSIYSPNIYHIARIMSPLFWLMQVFVG